MGNEIVTKGTIFLKKCLHVMCGAPYHHPHPFTQKFFPITAISHMSMYINEYTSRSLIIPEYRSWQECGLGTTSRSRDPVRPRSRMDWQTHRSRSRGSRSDS